MIDYQQRDESNEFWGNILAGVFIVGSIFLGIAEFVAPLVIIIWLWVYLSGRG